jgi:transcription termination factor Rho
VCDILKINDADPAEMARRPDFGSLIVSYPDKKLTLETGKPAKGGPELTRRAIDLIAPVGYGQRALIVAPARAGKTMLLQAIVEGVETEGALARLREYGCHLVQGYLIARPQPADALTRWLLAEPVGA